LSRAASVCIVDIVKKATLLASRYRIVRKLGAGGMSEVFEAVDTHYDLRVAVKVIRRAEGFSLLRFKEEFRSLADLRHPNLIRLFDLAFDGEKWFFTMELVDGLDLVTHVEALSGSPSLHSVESSLDESSLYGRSAVSSEIRRLFNEIASALQFLHSAGMVHRDIKPSNILVDSLGRPRILDFGIAKYIGSAEEIQEALRLRKVGTPGYVAPEQIRGRALPASDVYSLGVILYRMLAGKLPFRGRKKQVLVAHLTKVPRAPAEIRPEADAELSNLAMRMLRKDPAVRPTADEVRRLSEQDRSVLSIEIVAGGAAAESAAAFVGRSSEVRRVLGHLLELPLGRPLMVTVEGVSGIGKTRLAEEVLQRVRKHGVRCFQARCYEREQIPYKALDAVVDQLVSHVLSTGEADLLLRGIDPDGLAALARLFPYAAELPLGGGEKVSSYIATIDFGLSPERAYEALTGLLGAVAGSSGLVLLIDDLQWADDGSYELLHHLLHQSGLRIGIVATLRPDEGALPVWLATPDESMRIERVPLSPIDRAETEALIETIAQDIPPRVVEQVSDEAQGNPLAIEELVRFYAERASAETVSFAEMIERRLDELEPAGRAVLEVCAAAGYALDMDAVAAGAKRPSQETGFVAVDLVEKRLLRQVAGRERNVHLFPFHDRVTQIVLSRMEPSHKRRIHRRLAAQLAAARPNAYHALADHWRLAGVPERASSYALRAAEHAEEVQLLDRAVRYYALALGFPPAGIEEWQIRGKLASALDRSGRFAEAGRAFHDAARRAPKDVRGGLMLLGARAQLKAAETSTALRSMEKVTQHLWDEPLLLPRWRTLLGIGLEYLGSRRWFPSFLAPAPSVSPEHTELCIELASVTRALMPLRATHLTARALRLARLRGDPVMIARVLVTVAATLGSHGSPVILSRSRALLGAAEALFGGDPNVIGLGSLHGTRALLAALGCRWDDMRASMKRSLETFQAEGRSRSWHAQMVRVHGVIGEVEAGALHEAEEQSRALLPHDRTWGYAGLSGWVLWARVRVDLAFRRWPEAERLCRAGLRVTRSDASHSLWIRFRAGLAAALIGSSRDTAAVTGLERTNRVARGTMWVDPLGRGEFDQLAAFVYVTAARRDAPNRRLLRRARYHAARLHRSPHRYLRPRGTCWLAEIALLRGQPRRAVRLARRAVDELLASQQRLEAARALTTLSRAEKELGLPQAAETHRNATAQLAEILRRDDD